MVVYLDLTFILFKVKLVDLSCINLKNDTMMLSLKVIINIQKSVLLNLLQFAEPVN